MPNPSKKPKDQVEGQKKTQIGWWNDVGWYVDGNLLRQRMVQHRLFVSTVLRLRDDA
jgi:hypothetical protein